jgi:RHS repeat-associated protein
VLSHEKDWQETFYVRDAQGNVMAMYNHTSTFFANNNNYVSESISISEWNLYGSSRLGARNIDKVADVVFLASRNYNWVNSTVTNEYIAPTASFTYKKYRVLGAKTFELSNHLGNVITTISDRKLMVEDAQNLGFVHHYKPEILSIGEQYAFGISMPGRTFRVEDYRYGFNGKENQDELLGEDNAQDFGARMYDVRVGRWWGLDPLASKASNLSPYAAFANSPILMKDPDGKENAIYLTDLDLQKPGLTPTEYKAIMDKLRSVAADANQQYKENGINIVVGIVDYIPNATELDKTDVLATVGDWKQLYDFGQVNCLNKMGSPRSDSYDDVGADYHIGMELGSDQQPWTNGNYIAINRKAIHKFPDDWPAGSSFISEPELWSFLVRHAAGHDNYYGHPNEFNIMRDANGYPNPKSFNKWHNYITPEQKAGFNGKEGEGGSRRPHFNGKKPIIKLPESRTSKPKAVGPKAKYNPNPNGKAPSKPPTRRRID